MFFKYASGFVTMNDVETFFKGKSWPISEVDGDNFHGVSVWNFEVDFTRGKSTFKVSIESPEDPEDSDEFETDDPVRDIEKFLSRGMSDEWMKAASSVNAFSNLLRKLANSIEKSKNPSLSKVSRILRRVSLVEFPRSRVAFANEDLFSLEDRMASEGWKVQHRSGSEGEYLHVEVGDGLYQADIIPEAIQWKYTIQFIGNDELTVTGITDDPISEYDNWTKRPDLAVAYKAFKKTKNQPIEIDTDRGTIHDRSEIVESKE